MDIVVNKMYDWLSLCSATAYNVLVGKSEITYLGGKKRQKWWLSFSSSNSVWHSVPATASSLQMSYAGSIVFFQACGSHVYTDIRGLLSPGQGYTPECLGS